MISKLAKAILIFVFIFFNTTVNAQWEPVHNGPHQGDVYVIKKNGANVYAATRHFGIYFSDNDGQTWRKISDSLPNDYIADISIQNNILYAVMPYTGIYSTNNNGNSWQSINNGIANLGATSIAFNGSSIYLGTDNGLYQSINTGSSWSLLALAGDEVSDILINGNDIFVCTTTNGVYRSQNGGAFNSINVGLSDLWANNLIVKGSDIFLSTRTAVFKSVNNGTLWTAINGNLSSSLINFEIANDDSSLFLTSDAGVWRTDNDGALWSPLSNGLTVKSAKCMSINSDTLFVGTNIGIFRSYDAGNNWKSVGLNTGIINSLKKKGQLAIATSQLLGGIFISIDGTNNWRSMNDNLPLDTYHAGAITDSAIMIQSYSNGAFRSLDSGATWLPLNVFGMASIGPNIFGRFNNDLFYSNDNGANWTARNNGIASGSLIQDIEASDTAFFVATSTGLYSTYDAGLNWNQISLNPFPRFISTDGNRIIAYCLCSPGMSMHLSNDNGISWSAAIGDLPENYASGTAIKDSILFAGTLSNGVFYSINDGVNWIPINTGLPYLDILNLVLLDNYLYASTFEGLYRLNVDAMFTNITEHSLQIQLDIYPNPSTGIITIKVKESSEVNSLCVYDLFGKLIYLEENKIEVHKTLYLKLDPGIYIINYITAAGSSSKKIVVN